MTAPLFDDDDIARIAGDCVEHIQRQQELHDEATVLLDKVWPELVSAAIARRLSQEGDAITATDRAYAHIAGMLGHDLGWALEVLAKALVEGLWPHACKAAERDLIRLGRASDVTPVLQVIGRPSPTDLVDGGEQR